jgi:hypothetical protein
VSLENARGMWMDRILALADEDDRSEQALKFRGLQLFLQMHVSARLWFICFPREPGDPYVAIGLATSASLACLLGLKASWARAALCLTAATMCVKLAVTFPMSSNHFMLELLNVLLLISFDGNSAEERRLQLVGSRFITAIVIFYTGVQKVLYGTYFEGQFLAHAMATRESFAKVFELAIPAEEFSRLVNSRPERFGSGPFVVRSPFFLLISNAVYLIEIVAPVLLLLRKTRTLATFGVIGFMVFVQFGAREFFFGLLIVQLLLLFLPRAWNHRLLPGFLAAYVLLLSLHFWLLPEFEIH